MTIKKGLPSIICWDIWNIRNCRIFEDSISSIKAERVLSVVAGWLSYLPLFKGYLILPMVFGMGQHCIYVVVIGCVLLVGGISHATLLL